MFEKLEVKQSVVILSNTPTFKLINETHALTIEHSVFSVMVALIVEVLFMLFSVCNAVLWAENE